MRQEDPRGDLWGRGGVPTYIGPTPCKRGVDPDDRVVP